MGAVTDFEVRPLRSPTARLQQTVDLDTVQGELLDAIHHAFEPAHTSVWLAARDSAQSL